MRELLAPINRQQLQQIVNRNYPITNRKLITRMAIHGANPLNRIKYVLDIMEADKKVFIQKDGYDNNIYPYQYAIENNIQSVAPKDNSGLSQQGKSELAARNDQAMFNTLWQVPRSAL